MKIIASANAPAAIGPYSQALDTGNIVFCSGQIPLDPSSMSLVSGGITEETEQVFKNIKAVLHEAGCDEKSVVKTTVYLKEMDDFPAMNSIYEAFFSPHKPARSTVQVAGLPLNARVEIECIAVRTDT